MPGWLRLTPFLLYVDLLLDAHEIDDPAGGAFSERASVAFDEALHQQEQTQCDSHAGRGCEQVPWEHGGIFVVVTC